MDESTALLRAPPLGSQDFVVYKSRFWVLFVFSVIAFIQGLVWLTFSPISDLAQQYYGIHQSDTDLLLNLGPIVYLPIVPFTSFLTTRAGGLRLATMLSVWLVALAGVLRVIPTVWPDYFFGGGWDTQSGRACDGCPGRANRAMALVYLAQTLNAAAGPIVMSSGPKLSAAWFPSNERTSATAVGVLANNFGSAFGFLMMPGIVKSFPDVTTLLNLHAGLAVFILIMFLLYFPDAPPTPPSAAALADQDESRRPLFLRDVLIVCRNWSFLALATANGLTSGIFNAWTGVLSSLLAPKFSDSDAGWFGFSSTVGMIAGGFLMGPLADRFPWFHERFKLTILLILLADLLFFIWFTMSFPFDGHKELLPQSFWPVAIAITGGGIFLGASSPLFFELSVEMTYPAAEIISASVITSMTNVGTLAFLFVTDSLANYALNSLMVGSVVLAMVLVGLAKEDYRRRQMEAVKRPQVQLDT